MTLKESNLWYKFEGPSCYGDRVVIQWYDTHTILCNGMKCTPVPILKSQRHTFSQQKIFFLKSINSLFNMVCSSLETWTGLKGILNRDRFVLKMKQYVFNLNRMQQCERSPSMRCTDTKFYTYRIQIGTSTPRERRSLTLLNTPQTSI